MQIFNQPKPSVDAILFKGCENGKELRGEFGAPMCTAAIVNLAPDNGVANRSFACVVVHRHGRHVDEYGETLPVSGDSFEYFGRKWIHALALGVALCQALKFGNFFFEFGVEASEVCAGSR